MYTPGIYPYPSFLACINADTDTLTLATTGSAATDSTLRFSGTNSYKFSGGTKYASIALPSSFTISCVLQFTSGIASSVPFSLINSSDSTKSLELFMTSGGSFSVATGSSPSSATIISTGCAPPINTWYYIAITVSSAGVNLYINGFPNGTYTTSNSVTSAIYGNTVNLVLGALNTSGSNAFNGNIDDFRIYNGVLSQAQIGLIYTDMSYITPAYYASFDGGNATLLNGYFPSTSGSGIYSGDDTTKISGNYSLRVNGGAGGGCLVSNINNYGFSVSFWLRFNTLKNNSMSFPVLIEANSAAPNIAVCERFGKLYLKYGSPDNFNPSDGSGMALAIATWYHITLVNDYQTAKLYVNGAPLGTLTCGINNWNRIYISRTITDQNFDGWIDEYRFYQASLSSYQAMALYTMYNTNIEYNFNKFDYNFKNTSYSASAVYRLYTNFSNKVYMSTDSGSTYTEITLSTNPFVSPYISSIGKYMASCTTKELYYSSDYGKNWTNLMTLTGNDTFKNVALSENGLLLSVLYSSGIYVNTFLSLNNNNIAIGYQAGQLYQGSNSIAIGNKAGQTLQPPNTIILNANDTELNAYTPNGCFIAPISSYTNSTSTLFNLLGYGSDNQIVKLDGNLTFASNINLACNGTGTINLITGSTVRASVTANGIVSYKFANLGNNNVFLEAFFGGGNPALIFNAGSYDNANAVGRYMTINQSGIQFYDGKSTGETLLAGVNNLGMYLPSCGYILTGARYNSLVNASPGYSPGDMVFYCNAGGNVCLPQLAGESTRTVSAGTNGVLYIPPSDERLKKNKKTLSPVLDKLLLLNPITYEWDEESDMKDHPLNDGYIQYGFTAQNIQSQYPDFIFPLKIKDNTYYGYDEKKLFPVIVKAIQEQHAEIAELKAQLASLKAVVDALVSQKDLLVV